MISFNKIVSKLWKRWWKIIFKNDIFELIDPEKKLIYEPQVQKTIYQLKSQKVILSLRNGVYVVPEEEDFWLNEVDLVEKYYFPLVKKYLSEMVGGEFYISWKKALEFHLKDFSIPEKLLVVNRSLNKKVILWKYQIIFKTLQTTQEGKKINLFTKMKKFTQTKEIHGVNFYVSSLELSLLEASLISDTAEWVDVYLLNKAIKKYWKYFKKWVFFELGKYKFSMAFNRLKEISRTIHPDLSEVFLQVIKENGGNFIGEWLRKI